MNNIQVVWILPTVRTEGGPLPVSEIANTEIEMSADAGATWTNVGFFTPDILSVPINDLPPSDQYQVRGRVKDITGQVSLNWAVEAFTLIDGSPPGDLIIGVNIL